MKLLLLLASLHVAPESAYQAMSNNNDPIHPVDTFVVTPGVAVQADNGVTGMVFSNSFGKMSMAGMYTYRSESHPNTGWYAGVANGYEEMAGSRDGYVPLLGVTHTFDTGTKIKPAVSFTLPGVISFGVEF